MGIADKDFHASQRRAAAGRVLEALDIAIPHQVTRAEKSPPCLKQDAIYQSA